MAIKIDGIETKYYNDINYNFKYELENKIHPIFKLNNWIDKYRLNKGFGINMMDILNIIHDKNCAIWFNINGDICYRISIDGDTIISSWKKIGFVFHNLFGLDVEIKRYDYSEAREYTLITPQNKYKVKYTIYIDDLIMVQKDIFDPTKKEEFYIENDLFFKNTFKPTTFLTERGIYNYHPENSIILSYIYHLSNHNRKRFDYIVNWLANMFNNLTKSNIALILIGNKESGVDILFNDIIKPLFGFQYCIEIDDNDLESKHFDKLFKDKLFYNFNDISYDSVDNKTKNICKDVIEDSIIFLEQNHKETYQKVDIFAQTLITTSKPYIPIIDTNRVNYTIFNIKEDIKEIPIQKEDDKKSLYQNIKNDLDNFALFLKSFKVNINLANEPFKEDDKDIILDYDKNIYEIFIEAIKTKDKEFFTKIQEDKKLYKDLIYDFDRNRIKRSNLIKYFCLVYPEESTNHTRTLLKKLREIDQSFFDQKNISSSNSEQFFKIL
ncbi:MAG: hypothetical protein HWD90_08815 [Campylobacteraceae bacterium]|nr:hypothetical protein [Campylobacteraceae bacterium]